MIMHKTDILVHGENNSDHFAVSLNVQIEKSSHEVPHNEESIKLWWDRADLSQYQYLCSSQLSHLHLPTDALLCAHGGCTEHLSALVNYYCEIVNCLSSAAHSSIPQIKTGVEKQCMVDP